MKGSQPSKNSLKECDLRLLMMDLSHLRDKLFGWLTGWTRVRLAIDTSLLVEESGTTDFGGLLRK